MLTLKPNCELCDKDLPADSTEAMICTYECTFCSDCVNDALSNVCPNCGGGFVGRPIRPLTARRDGVSRTHQAPSTERVITKYTLEQIKEFAAAAKDIPPEQR